MTSRGSKRTHTLEQPDSHSRHTTPTALATTHAHAQGVSNTYTTKRSMHNKAGRVRGVDRYKKVAEGARRTANIGSEHGVEE